MGAIVSAMMVWYAIVGGKPKFKLYLPFLTYMLNQIKIGKVSLPSVFSLFGWVGWWVEKNISAPPDFGFRLYSLFFNFHAKLYQNWTERVRSNFSWSCWVGWQVGNNPNPFKL